MRKKTRPFREARLERLSNPAVAKEYLSLAIEEGSQEKFLKALLNVVQARQPSQVAKEAGVQRESLYRSLSESGNPTFSTLVSVLKAVGLRLSIEEDQPKPAPLTIFAHIEQSRGVICVGVQEPLLFEQKIISQPKTEEFGPLAIRMPGIPAVKSWSHQ